MSKSVVGSTCDGEGCEPAPECSASEQQLPENCARDASVCNDIVVAADEVACNECNAMIDRLNVESPIARCGCTYCAHQLTRCFASAETEPDGDPIRDRLCQAMVECGWAAGCAGSDCYCGPGVGRDTCLKDANEGRLKGACAGLIQSAAMCSATEQAGMCVLNRQLMPDTAHYRATEVAQCVSGDPILTSVVITPKCR